MPDFDPSLSEGRGLTDAELADICQGHEIDGVRAIERASEAQIVAALAELLTLRSLVREVEQDTAAPGVDPAVVASEFGIQSLAAEGGVATLAMTPTSEEARQLVLAMSLACGRMLDDDQAPNYIEFEVAPANHAGYVVHVRRAAGPSPHTLRRRAEASLALAEEALDEIAHHARPDNSGGWTDQSGALERISSVLESTGRQVWNQAG